MNLTELQVELRNIEEHLAALHLEIEKMKPKTDEKQEIDFEMITRMAKQHPLNHLKIAKEPEWLRKNFIYSLSYLLQAEDNDISGQLLYLCRLALGCKLHVTAEDIYRSGLGFEMSNLEKLCQEMTEYKYSYLTEAFIIANLSEETPVKMLGVIADIAKEMDCDNEEIRVIAQVAKSVLMNDCDVLNELPPLSKNRWSGKFGEYISQEWIVSQRKECITICTDKYERKNDMGGGLLRELSYQDSTNRTVLKHPSVIRNRVQAGSVVKKGDIILEYNEVIMVKDTTKTVSGSPYARMIMQSLDQEKLKEKKVTKTVKAPADGIVYFLESLKNSAVWGKCDKYMVAYVVSYFDDYNEIFRWHSSRG